MNNRQAVFNTIGLHVREAGEEGKKSRTIEGHAVVFGQRSVNLVPFAEYREVYEVMEPGSITDELIQRSDIVLTAFHKNDMILGRSVNGKGSLSLQVNEDGVLIRCTLAETADADYLLSAIERGDISGMSFAYLADEADSENGVSYENTGEVTPEGKEVWVRHVKKVTNMFDVTIAGHPAYPQTDVAKREICDKYDEMLGITKRQQAILDEQKAEEEKAAKEREHRLQVELLRRKRVVSGFEKHI